MHVQGAGCSVHAEALTRGGLAVPPSEQDHREMLKAVKSKINRADTVSASPRPSKTRGVCSDLSYANMSYSDLHFDLDMSYSDIHFDLDIFAWCKCFSSRTRNHTRPIPDPTTQT